ncbi:MAG: hypothetical protein AAGA65_28770 [Actinomycetota bacterium]
MVRSIKGWESGSHAPDALHRRVLDRVFEAHALAEDSGEVRELATVDFVTHLARQSGRSLTEVYGQVAHRAEQLVAEATAARLEREFQQRNLTCDDLTAAVVSYYDADESRYWQTTVGGETLRLPLLIRPEWTGLNVDLNSQPSGEFDVSAHGAIGPVDEPMFDAAVERLADAEANQKVLYDNPIYRLVDTRSPDGDFRLRFGSARFADFALGCGLMEAELARFLTAGGGTPIRDTLLPSVAAAEDLMGYVCAGGPVGLFAVARPAEGTRPPDYALLLQVRGAQVMDLSGRLSTIPKGWHQPVSEIAAQSDLRATLLRELEEELLGAEELELITAESRRTADPLHARARSAALEPFLHQTKGYHLRLAGFGLNLLAGTFEAPCLVAIDDENWWQDNGHLVTGNWETSGIEVHSSADADGVARLIRDPRWVSEGLFSLVEGLRCLAEVGDPDRVALPTGVAGR